MGLNKIPTIVTQHPDSDEPYEDVVVEGADLQFIGDEAAYWLNFLGDGGGRGDRGRESRMTIDPSATPTARQVTSPPAHGISPRVVLILVLAAFVFGMLVGYRWLPLLLIGEE